MKTKRYRTMCIPTIYLLTIDENIWKFKCELIIIKIKHATNLYFLKKKKKEKH